MLICCWEVHSFQLFQMDDLHVVSERMSFDNAKELHLAGDFCDLVGMLPFL